MSGDKDLLRRSGLWGRLSDRITGGLRGRPDSEIEQAGLRLGIGVVVCSYLLTLDLGGADAGAELTMLWFIGLFLVASLIILVSVILHPVISPVRRVVGILTDLSATSAGMALAGESGAPLLAIYLWVIVGNGFRYGTGYLAYAAGIALVGFVAVYFCSPYWQSQRFFAISFLFILAVIPAYMAALLRKLQQAMRRSDEANRAKSLFLAKMSHELRTPLNGVIGMAELLMDSALSTRQRSFARSIKASADSLLGIIESILDFSKIEAGRIELEHIDFDLHHLVTEIAGGFRIQAARKGLAFRVQLAPDVPFALRGDPLHLRQILLNLLSNAVKFTDHGEVGLVVDASRDTDGDRTLIRFEVIDTGIGIAEEDQARVFESFRQAHRSTQRLFGGTGLGTAIARELTLLMGGEIGLTSRLGEGSRFWVQIPLQAQTPGELAQAPGLAGTRVLVVGTGGGWVLERLAAWNARISRVQTRSGAFAELLRAHRNEDPFSAVIVLAAGLDSDLAELVSGMRSERRLDNTDLLLVQDSTAETEDSHWHQAGYTAVLHTPLAETQLFNTLHAAQVANGRSGNLVSLDARYRRAGNPTAASLHILVAEDNETNRLLLRELLTRIGHRVTTVTDGDQALDALESRGDTFDLMILDKNMPRHSGVDVFRAHRFMAPQRQIPTIILTADATADALAESRAAGVDAFLTKPLDTGKLFDTLAQLAPRRSPTDQSPLSSAAPSPALTAVDLTLPTADAPVPQGACLVDNQKLSSLFAIGSDSSFFSQLIEGFLGDSRAAIDEAQAALSDPDYPRLHEALHALRGSAGELGAVQIIAVCDQLRRLRPFELTHPETAALMRTLRDTHARTAAFLQAYTGSAAPADR